MKKYIAALIVLLLILAVIDYYSYTPPLLDRGSRNPLEIIHDTIAFIWYYTGAVWNEGSHAEKARMRRMTLAVWYRPSLSEKVLGLPSDDLSGLAERFESRGLPVQAAALFAAGYERGERGADRAEKTLRSCAVLGAWDEVIEVARRAVADNPGYREGYYWWGRALLEKDRPREALEIFLSAPESADQHYRRGLARQKIGETFEAVREYLRAVELSPGNRASWTALSNLYADQGEIRMADAAGGRARGLTPEVSSSVRFGTSLIFRGHQRLPEKIEGEEEFPFTFFYECLPGAEETVIPRLRFQAGYFQKLVTLSPVVLHPAAAGEIRRVAATVALPWNICPLPSTVTISFLNRAGVPLRIPGSSESELLLGPVDIVARIFPSAVVQPGKNDTSLDMKTVLAGTAEVHTEVGRENRCRGLGIISFTEGSTSLPGGTEIARTECWTADGKRFDFPIRLGEETADRWLESRAPGRARHSPARIFSSHREERKGKVFNSHSYRTVLPFPATAELKLIKMTYTCPQGGSWVIESLFLAEGDENGDGGGS